MWMTPAGRWSFHQQPELSKTLRGSWCELQFCNSQLENPIPHFDRFLWLFEGFVIFSRPFSYTAGFRLGRWYLTIPLSDQCWTTIKNHHYQWLPDPKAIGKPSFPMVTSNHSIQWCPNGTPLKTIGTSMVAKTSFKPGLNCCKWMEINVNTT